MYLSKIKAFFYPSGFSFGSDIEHACRLPNRVFYKKFKPLKYDKFCKTLYVLDQIEQCSRQIDPFVPKVLQSTPALELYLTDCGDLLRVDLLPKDWEAQLMVARDVMIRARILLKDWGLWELNPFVLNNLCGRYGRIYFIDIGDAVAATPAEIRAYFQKKIRAIKLVQRYGIVYLLFHFPRRIFIMLYRIMKRPMKMLVLGLIYLLWTAYFLQSKCFVQ